MRFKKLSTLGFVLAFGVACSDSGTGPADDFDPAQSAADLEAISAAFDSDVLESLGATGESFSAVSGVPAMAVQMLEASTDLAIESYTGRISESGRRMARTLMSASSSVVLIPDAFRGRTYVFDSVDGWSVDEALTDAPANGMRFTLYAIDPITHDIAEPLNAFGHVDIMDESTATAGSVRLSVVSGTTEFVNYAVTVQLLVNEFSVNIAGFVSDGTTQVDFDLSTISPVYDTDGVLTGFTGLDDDTPLTGVTSLGDGLYAAFLTNDPAEGITTTTDNNKR